MQLPTPKILRRDFSWILLGSGLQHRWAPSRGQHPSSREDTSHPGSFCTLWPLQVCRVVAPPSCQAWGQLLAEACWGSLLLLAGQQPKPRACH